MVYNANNIFYKIITKEIKAHILHEGEHFLAINDIAPKAPVHVLVIPKGKYVDYHDFASNASDAEILEINRGIATLIEQMHLIEGGYRIISNSKSFGEQEVMHLHFHILGKSSQ